MFITVNVYNSYSFKWEQVTIGYQRVTRRQILSLTSKILNDNGSSASSILELKYDDAEKFKMYTWSKLLGKTMVKSAWFGDLKDFKWKNGHFDMFIFGSLRKMPLIFGRFGST